MPSNSLLHFISNIVNFAGFKAKDYHFITDTELVIKLEKIEKLATCPHCDRTTDKVHQSHWYRVRDIPFSGWDVFLSVNRRQFKCLMELDNARKKEKRAAQTIKNGQEKARILSGITHSKYPLLKNKIDLDDREKEKLEELDLVAPKLTKMHQIKEDFRNIFEQHITADEAFWLLIEWTENAYTFFPNSCQTIKRWIDEIAAYFDRRTTQGVVEGINQKIKLIKRRAYGIPIFENFRRRILLNWHFCC
jgi:transposase